MAISLRHVDEPRQRCVDGSVFAASTLRRMSHDPEIRRSLGERLATARAMAGMSLSQVAQRLDISRATVGAWEVGRNVPDAIQVRRLAKLYRISTDELISEEPLTPEQLGMMAAVRAAYEAGQKSIQAVHDTVPADLPESSVVLGRPSNGATQPTKKRGQQS